jgi:drug/metabolite transporter (DMT)-like permease
MIGAWFFFREAMHWERWAATLIGFIVMLVVVGTQLSGAGGRLPHGDARLGAEFAASLLLTNSLTRADSPGVIVVWQSISVSLFSLPLALWPT